MVAPIQRPVQVDLGGFAFTTGGICLPVTSADVSDLVSTLFFPQGSWVASNSNLSGVITAADLAAPGSLPVVSTPSAASYNATLVASGYGSISIRIIGISYGLNIIANEDHAANTKAFYARQVQTDTFTLQVQFLTSAERRQFYTWAMGYAAAAVSPSTVGLIVATYNGTYDDQGNMLSAPFSMSGVLTSGMTEATQVSDVTWTMGLNFSGAQFTSTANEPTASSYTAPKDAEAAQYFYPNSSNLTSNKPDSLYASEQSYLHPSPPTTAPFIPNPGSVPAKLIRLETLWCHSSFTRQRFR
jgi:hypothetical protein